MFVREKGVVGNFEVIVKLGVYWVKRVMYGFLRLVLKKDSRLFLILI